MPRRAVEFLDTLGNDVQSAVAEGLAGVPDRSILERCRTEKRVLITPDLDFADVRCYPPSSHAGVVVLRPGASSVEATIRVLARIQPLLDREPAVARLWVVDEEKVRIRE